MCSSDLVAIITRRFRKFYRKNRSGSMDDRLKGKKPSKYKTCFECGEPRHFIADCPKKKAEGSKYKKKEHTVKKKFTKYSKPSAFRSRKNFAAATAFIGQAWASDDSGSAEESDEEETEIAGITIGDSDASSFMISDGSIEPSKSLSDASMTQSSATMKMILQPYVSWQKAAKKR